MPTHEDNREERQARLDFMVEEFRAARQRRLAKAAAIARTRAAADVPAAETPLVPEKLN